MSTFYPLKVSRIEALTPNSAAITFEIAEDHKTDFLFKAGQYITIKKEISGQELRRAYSISSAPGKSEITIGVKRVDHGGFSDYANTKLKAGDTLDVSTPEGRFVFDGKDKKDVIAIAAGSGITPIMSIARTLLDGNAESRLVLIYGNQSKEEAMFYEELKQLQNKYTDRFFIQEIYSRSREEGALFGRIDNSVVNYVVKNKFKEFNFDNYYLCGPEPMINLVRDVLDRNGVSADKVLYELFTTSQEEEEQNTMKEEGKTQLTIILDEEEQQIEMDRKETVLDALLKADIDAPYSCQGGICSTCIARISNGEAVMEKNQILTDGEIADGYVLTCQAHPKTPTLTVDYDDV